MYTRNFFRATWILASLDAGFLTGMAIKSKWQRDLLSVLFSFAYLFFPDAAEEKIRKFKHSVSVDTIRTCWAKSTNPYLSVLTFPFRGFLSIRKNIKIPFPKNPAQSAFNTLKENIDARLYFSGTLRELESSDKLIFMCPGGGFVCQSPENHDDYTSNWAKQTKIPIVSINYGKAPETPYPGGLEDCYNAYKSIIESNGECLGIKSAAKLKIIAVGDSAGANLVSGVIMKCIEDENVDVPEALLLVYPVLSFGLECWVKPDNLNLMREKSYLQLDDFVKSKTKLRPTTPLATEESPKSINVLTDEQDRRPSHFWQYLPKFLTKFRHKASHEAIINSCLSMTSRMTYFEDRIISPECIM
jgi:acetyl esterase/lipase